VKDRRPPPLRRRASFREPKLRIDVFCEGKLTEPGYLASCAALYRHNLFTVRVLDCGLDPRQLVMRAVAHKKRLSKEARRTRDSSDARFEVWAVFDVDQHRWFDEARNHARDAGVFTATSNPCFELWAIYHFADLDAPVTVDECCRRLAQLCTPYSDAKKQFLADYFGVSPEEKQQAIAAAIARGRASVRRRQEEGTPDGCPSTRLYELMERFLT
jgi:hypothetical protein